MDTTWMLINVLNVICHAKHAVVPVQTNVWVAVNSFSCLIPNVWSLALKDTSKMKLNTLVTNVWRIAWHVQMAQLVMLVILLNSFYSKIIVMNIVHLDFTLILLKKFVKVVILYVVHALVQKAINVWVVTLITS